MCREVRKVPKDWIHPRGWIHDNKQYTPLYNETYEKACEEYSCTNYTPKPEKYVTYDKYDDSICTHFQLYETTSEGTPLSPVFETLEELIDYATENCTVFADYKVSKTEWIKMINDDNFYIKDGNITWM